MRLNWGQTLYQGNWQLLCKTAEFVVRIINLVCLYSNILTSYPFYFISKIRLQYSKLLLTVRSSHPEVFCKKGILRNFAKFTGKHLCRSLFLNKVAGLRQWCCLPVNFAKFLRTPFIIEHLWWLLLTVRLSLLKLASSCLVTKNEFQIIYRKFREGLKAIYIIAT